MTTHYIHRGLAKKKFKENTIQSFKYCFKKKFGIETDLQVTKDNKLICFHDSNLKRTFKLNVNVKNHNTVKTYQILLDQNGRDSTKRHPNY